VVRDLLAEPALERGSRAEVNRRIGARIAYRVRAWLMAVRNWRDSGVTSLGKNAMTLPSLPIYSRGGFLP